MKINQKHNIVVHVRMFEFKIILRKIETIYYLSYRGHHMSMISLSTTIGPISS